MGLEQNRQGRAVTEREMQAESWYDKEAAGFLFPQLPSDSHDIHQPPDWKY